VKLVSFIITLLKRLNIESDPFDNPYSQSNIHLIDAFRQNIYGLRIDIDSYIVGSFA